MVTGLNRLHVRAGLPLEASRDGGAFLAVAQGVARALRLARLRDAVVGEPEVKERFCQHLAAGLQAGERRRAVPGPPRPTGLPPRRNSRGPVRAARDLRLPGREVGIGDALRLWFLRGGLCCLPR